LILRSVEKRISISMQVHDGPPDERHSPSVILSADPCRFAGRDLHFAACLRAWRELSRSTIQEIAKGRCEL
jgi:hypothetical protein